MQGGRAANQWVLPHRFENSLPLVARLCQNSTILEVSSIDVGDDRRLSQGQERPLQFPGTSPFL